MDSRLTSDILSSTVGFRRLRLREPEYHSRDETAGQKVANYGLETRIEAAAELSRITYGAG